LKIVYITNARLPTEKAHGVQILKMIKAFSGLGNQTVLVHPKRHQREISHKTDVFDFYQMEKVFQVKSLKFIDPYIFRPFMPKFLYRFFSFIIDFIWGIFSINYTKKYSPDFLIFRDNTPFSLFFSYFSGIPSVIEFHDMPPLISKRIFKFTLKRAKKIKCFSVTKKLSLDLENYFGLDGGSIKVLQDAVDLEDYIGKPKIKSSSDMPILTYCGSLSHEKGVDLLLETATNLEGFQIIIVGGLGAEVKIYSEKAKKMNIDNIRFIGQVLPSEVPNYLNSSDILLLPSSAKSKKSREYTSAMKLFEYLASGIPIIASNIPSNTEILTGDKNCILFNPDDSDSLVREIKKLWQNYDLREKISHNSIELSKEFTWESRCKVIIDEIKQIK